MKYILTSFFLGLFFSGVAQIEFDFGKLTAKDMEMKVCPFDPEAHAVVLTSEGYSDYNDEGNMITYYHKRIKVLNKNGFDYSNIILQYIARNDYEYIDDIVAMSINIDENGKREDLLVEKNSIYFKKISSNTGQVSFAFPEVRIGTILEYRYRKVSRSFMGLSQWNFQEKLPVCFSSYELHPDQRVELAYNVQKSPQFNISIKQSKGNDKSKIYFEMKDIPSLGNEPYMDAREDYLQKVSFQMIRKIGEVSIENFMTSWKEVATKLLVNPWFGKEIGIRLKNAEEGVHPKCEGKTDEEKVQIIYDYVRSNLIWNHSTWFMSEGVKTCWENKSGNSGTINLILINLLKSAGLNVYPLLVSERGNGKINTEKPYIYDFNNVYAIVSVNQKKFYLNATDRFTPYNLIPYKLLNTTAYICDFNAGRLITLDEPEVRYREIISIDGTLNADGTLAGAVQLVSKDYARTERMRNYKLDKEKYIEEDIKAGLVNIKVDSLVITNLENDNAPLQHNFNFSTHINETGDYEFIILNLFMGLNSNPFVADYRYSNINFGYKKTINLSSLIKLPGNVHIDALPKNIQLVNADKTVSISRTISFDQGSGQIAARIKLEINKSLFSVDEYPDIREFYKKMVDLLNEPVVLKKN